MSSFEMTFTGEVGAEDRTDQKVRESDVAPEQSLRSALQDHFQNPFGGCRSREACGPGRTPLKLLVLAFKLIFVIVTVSKLHLTSVGSLFASSDEDHQVTICVEYYDLGVYNISTKDIQFDQTRRRVCNNVGTNTSDDYNLKPTIMDLIRGDNGSLVRLIRVEVGFYVDSVHIDMGNTADTSPRCFRIHGTILFDNSDINGQIPVQLHSDVWEMVCTLNGAPFRRDETGIYVLGSFSILFTSFSLIICLRSVFKSFRLCCKTKKYIKAKFGTPLSMSEQLEIVSIKEIITMIGDVIILIGLLIFIVLSSSIVRSSALWYDVCGSLFGIGIIMTCFGALHFLSFNKGFHILFDVMGKSLLPVLRFLGCAVVLFVSFALCGWIVMGPYHIKFSSIYSTFRCLFGLISGDEIYVTLAAIDDEFSFPWWFCAAFITLYTTIFTLVALNILIAIFTTAYESVKNQTIRNQVKSTLIRFMDE
ncbi:mucolipin-2-like isoform X2 [Argopecten irradians]|uniref:mucolipin-2-like isoform X2 n=1 Tax=Argopecten irradians TaxID=31199 RepID=UPI0037114EB6